MAASHRFSDYWVFFTQGDKGRERSLNKRNGKNAENMSK